jgi:hypothetical protein
VRLSPDKEPTRDTFLVRRIARLRIGNVPNYPQTCCIDQVHIARPSSRCGDKRAIGRWRGPVNVDCTVVKWFSNHCEVGRSHSTRHKPERRTRILIEAREVHCVNDRVAVRINYGERV